MKTPRAARTYFVLLLQNSDGRWGVEFGDYDRECVKSELDDFNDRGVAKKFLRIISCPDRQADIDAAVAKINSFA